MSEPTDATIDDITADLLQLADSEGDVLARASAEAITALREKLATADALINGGMDEATMAIIAAERAEVLALRAERDKFEAAFWEAEGKLTTMTAKPNGKVIIDMANMPAPSPEFMAAMMPAFEGVAVQEMQKQVDALEAERDAWKAQCEAVEREAAKCFSAQEEIDAAWDAFGTSGNRKVLSLAEQIASHQREVDDARVAYARGVHDAAKALQSVADNWDCGHMESRLCDCRPLVEQWALAADEVRALADAPPAPVVGVKPHVIEREIWQAMAWAMRHAKQLPGGIMPAYTDTGNSDAETEARRCAARILAALLPQAEGGEG